MIKSFFKFLLLIVLIGLVLPQDFIIPVENATNENWDKNTFWFYPWGQSIVHKGVDIFASEGTNVHASTMGFIVSVDSTNNGGNMHVSVLNG